jgi:hypothetical protein
MRLSLLPGLIMLVHAHQVVAQTPSPAPLEVVRLVGGSSLVGRVTATGDGKVHMFVEGLGDVVIDSAAVASRSPAPTAPPPPSPWSLTLTPSVTLVSTVVPDVSGSTFGGQMKLEVTRTGVHGSFTFAGDVSYLRVDPDPAAVNQWELAIGGRRLLTPRWVLLGRTGVEVNHVQYLQYRSTTLAGLGYFVVQSDRASLLLAPGLGYGKSEQTAEGRVLSFIAGVPPSVEGLMTGVHDVLTLQLAPMLSFKQDMHYFWGLSTDTPYQQAEFNAQLLGMVTTHLGLSIAFRGQYDSSMPPPVKRALWTLTSGVELKL